MVVTEIRESVSERSDRTIVTGIGNTPLIELGRVCDQVPSGVKVYVKAEHLNPGGSVKDRAAFSMIRAAVRDKTLTHDKILLDATSGNTGIAYAMIGAALGYRVTLCLPQNAGPERKRTVRIYGAEVIETDPLQATDGAQIMAREMVTQNPERYCYLDQYNNEANWLAHYHTTASEIWEQTRGRITHFIAGLGTSGTFVGTTRRLKEFNPNIRAVSMQPDSPLHGLEGMKHMATAQVPGIYDQSLADSETVVATEEAQEMTRRLAREEGLFVGVSAGANVFAALRLARELPSGSLVATILCDTGSRYINEKIW
ncbi:MAG: PLP-dependent cysteine synthase family protein [Pyrinomonadaceae bacterium]